MMLTSILVRGLIVLVLALKSCCAPGMLRDLGGGTLEPLYAAQNNYARTMFKNLLSAFLSDLKQQLKPRLLDDTLKGTMRAERSSGRMHTAMAVK
jgi:hypothetical protein